MVLGGRARFARPGSPMRAGAGGGREKPAAGGSGNRARETGPKSRLRESATLGVGVAPADAISSPRSLWPPLARIALFALLPSQTLQSSRTSRRSRPCIRAAAFALRSLFTGRAILSGIALVPLGALFALRSLLAGVTLVAFGSLRALRNCTRVRPGVPGDLAARARPAAPVRPCADPCSPRSPLSPLQALRPLRPGPDPARPECLAAPAVPGSVLARVALWPLLARRAFGVRPVPTRKRTRGWWR